jgi:Colon cancer-associated protein Mic1-like
MQDPEIEVLLMQHLRTSRLCASTALSGTPLNGVLMEYTPSQRVLSGEIIVFQNEMIEIFKEMILEQTSKKNEVRGLTYKYVSSMIIEFFHSLVENTIPQQVTLQNMLVKYILDNKDFPTFQMLLQYHVLNETIEMARLLINLGSHDVTANQDNTEAAAPGT